MLRRIVLVKPHEWLQEGWTQRSFGPAGANLEASVKVKGVEFNPNIFPVPVFGRPVPTMGAPPVRFSYGTMDAPTPPAQSTYAVVGHFDDQEAIERLKRDRDNEVVGVFADLRIEATPAVYCHRGPVGTFGDVVRRLGIPKLRRAGLTGKGTRIAVVDTGIHGAHPAPDGKPLKKSIIGGYSPRPNYQPGSSAVGHGTMVAFDTLLSAPQAKLLDYALLQTTARTWESFLSDALVAFASLIDLLQSKPGPLVVNNSWGLFNRDDDAPVGSPENYSANPDHPFSQIVGSLVAAGADVLFAAGNCGENCPDGRCGLNDIGPGASIHGANSHPSVLTVAAITVRKQRLGYSSQGPGGLDKRKPDIAAYSHFSGSGVYKADGGTSAASPVAAGVVAALRQCWPKMTPADMKGIIQKSAKPVGTGWNYELGYGILNAAKAWRAAKEHVTRRAPLRKPRKKETPGQRPAWMLEPCTPEEIASYAARLKRKSR